MEIKAFIKIHRNDWHALEHVTNTIQKRKGLTSPEIIEQLQILYHKASQNLSYCQTYFPEEEVTGYLNQLVMKAHHCFYRDQVTSWFQIKTFFQETFLRLLVEQKKFIGIAFLLFLLGAVFAFASIMVDPLHIYSILPAQIAKGIDPSKIGKNTVSIDSPTISVSIMTNNIMVAIYAFAGGLTLGLFTIYSLVNNGIILGALAAVYYQHGKFYAFWAYIIPHGMIELTAIFIAGGAGLLMGYRLLVPGPFSRGYQLKYQTLRSVQLLLGTVPLFIIAGIIEGFITPAQLPLSVKYGFACLTVIGLLSYVVFGQKFLRKQEIAR